MIPQNTFTQQKFIELCKYHFEVVGKKWNAKTERKILKEFNLKRNCVKKNDVELIEFAYYFSKVAL